MSLTYYEKNRDKILEKNKLNKEQRKQYYNKWYNENTNKVKEIRALYFIENGYIWKEKRKKAYIKNKNEETKGNIKLTPMNKTNIVYFD